MTLFLVYGKILIYWKVIDLFSLPVSSYVSFAWLGLFKNSVNFIPQSLKVVFPFPFSSKYCLISVEISSLTHVLFARMMLNLQVFGNFPTIFLLLISISFHCQLRAGIVWFIFFFLSIFLLLKRKLQPRIVHKSLAAFRVFPQAKVARRNTGCPANLEFHINNG